jgi:hypothetical protein
LRYSDRLRIKRQSNFFEFEDIIVDTADKLNIGWDMTDPKREIKLLLDSYVATKHLYPRIQTFVGTYNTIRNTHFTVEQLEKYLLLI